MSDQIPPYELTQGQRELIASFPIQSSGSLTPIEIKTLIAEMKAEHSSPPKTDVGHTDPAPAINPEN